MKQRLPQHELEQFLLNESQVGASTWVVLEGKLCISLTFADFAHAFAFMTSIAAVAHQADHHPEWSNLYNRVEIALTTHDAGGLTRLDLDLAREIANAYSRHGRMQEPFNE